MLTARKLDGSLIQLVHLTKDQIDNLRNQLHYCPRCKAPVVIKHGENRIAHFAHRSRNTCVYNQGGETVEHLMLKKIFAKWCEIDQLDYQLEKYLPELKQQPDILFQNIALEFQCSKLPLARFLERTITYQKNGFQPIWICGENLFAKQNALTELEKNFCYYSKNKGYYIWKADIKNRKLKLYYHIEEDQLKNYHFFIKEWSFYSKPLLEILNYPKNSSTYKQRTHTISALVKSYYFHLKKHLKYRNKQQIDIQMTFYLKQLHLLEVSPWFYYPGIRLFCCKRSDLYLKLAIWEKLEQMNKETCSFEQIKQLLCQIIRACEALFFDFPNISEGVIVENCFQQMYFSLIRCNHLLSGNGKNRWQIHIPKLKYSQEKIQLWFKQLENHYLISAIPIKNMIRYF